MSKKDFILALPTLLGQFALIVYLLVSDIPVLYISLLFGYLLLSRLVDLLYEFFGFNQKIEKDNVSSSYCDCGKRIERGDE